MSEAAREMTLAEWVHRLPETHRARHEYTVLVLRLTEAERLLAVASDVLWSVGDDRGSNKITAFLNQTTPIEGQTSEWIECECCGGTGRVNQVTIPAEESSELVIDEETKKLIRDGGWKEDTHE